MKWTVGIVLCFMFSQVSLAGPSQNRETSAEFIDKMAFEEARRQDFYIHQIELDRLDANRRRGEAETRAERRKIENEYEKYRLEFVHTRKAKPPEDPSIWEREIKIRMAAAERERKDFVRRRDEMLRRLSRIRGLSEDEEYHLGAYSDTSD